MALAVCNLGLATCTDCAVCTFCIITGLCVTGLEKACACRALEAREEPDIMLVAEGLGDAGMGEATCPL